VRSIGARSTEEASQLALDAAEALLSAAVAEYDDYLFRAKRRGWLVRRVVLTSRCGRPAYGSLAGMQF
jgi:hypothetical protein